ncbi:hypothetical protein H0H93_016311 [Arthromyces matolae]|nr:hypothetical protein H0H93_016311 [Arthromyces matolae]
MDVEKIARFFDIRAPHLCSLLITAEDEDDNLQSFDIVSEAVGNGLNRCPRIYKLICHGFPGPAFPNSRWLSSFAPNLALNITSLVTTQPWPNVSHALVGLKQVLQSIVVSANDPLPSTFRFPTALPNLRHITWSDFGHQSQLSVLKKIIHLIHLDEENILLKTLRLNFHSARAPEVLQILSIDGLGAGLTTLHIYFDEFSKIEGFAVNVLNICRNLVDFSHTSPFQKAALERLPPSIEYLQLLLGADDWSATAVDFVRILRVKQLPDLRFVKLHTRTSTEFETQDLLSFCNEFNIKTWTNIHIARLPGPTTIPSE